MIGDYMRNTGEMTLHLPKLDDGWQWNIAARECEEFGGKMLEVIVKAERGVYVSDDKEMPYEAMHSMPIYLRDSEEYDQIISKIQAQVDYLAERVKYWDKPEKTPADAWKHILNTFNSQPIEALHLNDSVMPVTKML